MGDEKRWWPGFKARRQRGHHFGGEIRTSSRCSIDNVSVASRTELGAPVILNTGFSRFVDREAAQELVDKAGADVVSVGRLALANPDLVKRWREDAPLNAPNQATFYIGEEKGYTDYPALQRS